jgi:hypothetical protein
MFLDINLSATTLHLGLKKEEAQVKTTKRGGREGGRIKKINTNFPNRPGSFGGLGNACDLQPHVQPTVQQRSICCCARTPLPFVNLALHCITRCLRLPSRAGTVTPRRPFVCGTTRSAGTIIVIRVSCAAA